MAQRPVRDTDCVVRRALGLAALAYRWTIESERTRLNLRDWQTEKTRAKITQQREANQREFEGLTQWANSDGALDTLTARERHIWDTPLGEFGESEFMAGAIAGHELAVLSWSLGLYDLRPVSSSPDLDHICEALFVGESEAGRKVMDSLPANAGAPVLGGEGQIDALDHALVLYLWRIRTVLQGARKKVDVGAVATREFGEEASAALEFLPLHGTRGGDLVWLPMSLVLREIGDYQLHEIERAIASMLGATRWLLGLVESTDSWTPADELLTSAST